MSRRRRTWNSMRWMRRCCDSYCRSWRASASAFWRWKSLKLPAHGVTRPSTTSQLREPRGARELVAVDAPHLLPDRGARLADEFLRLVGDAHAALSQHLARDGVVLAGEELQQRGLPRAVAPDDADLLAALDGERH